MSMAPLFLFMLSNMYLNFPIDICKTSSEQSTEQMSNSSSLGIFQFSYSYPPLEGA